MKGNMKEKSNIPKCIGIIMDGNRRWARGQGLPAFLGHTEGYKKFKEFLIWAKEEKIKHVIAYAFSTENWSRSEDEIGHLITLLRGVLDSELDMLKKEGVHMKFIGELDRFPADIVQKIKSVEAETAQLEDIEIIIALSYGGRAEIISAIINMSIKDSNKITEEDFIDQLYTRGTPDPDLIIRTGGEMRLSNFLLWQAAYSELYFSKTLWPDFNKVEFVSILNDYKQRERRRGK